MRSMAIAAVAFGLSSGLMGKPLRDLTGQTFTDLVVLERVERQGRSTGAWWSCKCQCGTIKSLPSSDLLSGRIASCGCRRRRLASTRATTHGKTGSRTFRIWQAMKTRCSNPRARNWQRYGGRGIAVCERWLSFDAFLMDMGEAPDGYSLDRVDNDGCYEPANCRWATRLQQANNTSANVFIEFDGMRLSRSEWERRLGLGKTTIRSRLRSGLAVEKALVPLARTGK